MFSQRDVEILAKELPTEAIMEIHIDTGISRPTIYRFLQGKKIRPAKQERIYIKALEIIERGRHRKKKIRKKRTQILNIA